MNDLDRLWVDPRFKKVLKKRAIDEDCTITDLTKKLATEMEEEENRRKKAIQRFPW